MNDLAWECLVEHSRGLLDCSATPEVVDLNFKYQGGWHDLLEGSLKVAQFYSKRQGLEIVVRQIKEKFGLLRIYHQGGDKVVNSILGIAELVSGGICEVCGQQGRVLVREGWVRTRCSEHASICREPQLELESDQDYVHAYVVSLIMILCFFKSGALNWVQNKCVGLGGRCPVELMSSTKGCLMIQELLNRLGQGVGV